MDWFFEWSLILSGFLTLIATIAVIVSFVRNPPKKSKKGTDDNPKMSGR
jgi:hypothetical protein